MSGFEIIAGIGTLLSTAGAVAGAETKSENLKTEAAYRDQQAAETRAAAQRNAMQKREQAKTVLSRQQAIAAASGGGATDPGVVDLMAETASEGDLRARYTQYEGDARAQGMNYQAAINRWSADRAQTEGYLKAGATLLSGFSEMGKYRRKFYGGDEPKPYWEQ